MSPGPVDRVKLKLRGAQQRRRGPAEVQRINGELAGIAEAAMREADAVIRNARRGAALGDRAAQGRLHRAINDLDTLAERTAQVAAQTRNASPGSYPSRRTRSCQLHDPDARPIAKGRLGKPVEFGYKAQIVDNEDGVILDHNVEIGNPPDAPHARPRDRTHHPPHRTHTTRGDRRSRLRRSKASKTTCTPLGVRHVVLPRKGKPTAARREIEHRRAFREDGPMAHRLRRTHQLRQTRLRLEPHRIDGLHGARTWCGHGIFAHNLVKIGSPHRMNRPPTHRAAPRRRPHPGRRTHQGFFRSK